MKFNVTKDGSILKIELSGKLDATNAPELEQSITKELSTATEVIFDVKELEYISSAGLRVILKAKHAVDNTSVINASAEVYDIFEMTGFSEMMSVSKKYRELSVEGCEVIGKGYCGTVYRISKDTIVKVYQPKMTLVDINRERELARKAFVLGIPTAIPYDVVKVGENFGSVFELLEAETLQKRIINDMEHIDDYIAQYIKVLKTIHGNEVKPGELYNKKTTMLEYASSIQNHLDKETGEKLINLINNIKEDNHLIHGDYHIKNIMVQNNEPFIIDMDTLSMGSPIFELGFMYSCYQAYQEIDRANGKEFFGIDQDVLDYIYNKSMDMYFEGKSKEYIAEVIKKARILSYTQLLDRFIKNNDHPEEIKLFKKEITELVSEIDDLNI